MLSECVAELKGQAAEAFRRGDLQICILKTNQAIAALDNRLGAPLSEQRLASARDLSCLHSNLSAAFIELGDYQSSAKEARAAIELDPSWHRPYLRLCTALTAMHGCTDAAKAALSRGLANCQDPGHLQELQTALSLFQGQTDALDEVPRKDSDHTTACQQKEIYIPNHDQSDSKGPKRQRFTKLAQAGLRHGASLGKAIDQEMARGIATDVAGITEQAEPEASVPATAKPISSAKQRQHRRVLPVTVLCGFLGAGKTTLVRHLLGSMGSSAITRVGLLVNDLAELNIDGQLLARLHPTWPQTTTKAMVSTLSGSDARQAPPPKSDGGGLLAATHAAATGSRFSRGSCDDRQHQLLEGNGTLALSNCIAAGSVEQTEDAAIATPATVVPRPPVAGVAAAFTTTIATTTTVAMIAPAVNTTPLLAGELLEFSNGCVCCNLRGELQQQLRRLAARQPPLEHLIIECTGVGEPGALAAAVRELAAEGLELRSLVTVVDVSTFLDIVGGRARQHDHHHHHRLRQHRRGSGAMDSSDKIEVAVQKDEAGRLRSGADKGPGDGDDDGGKKCMGRVSLVCKSEVVQPPVPCLPSGVEEEGKPRGTDSRKPLSQLLMQQVETADVVLLNKCDRLLERAKEQQQQDHRQQVAGAAATKIESLCAIASTDQIEAMEVEREACARRALRRAQAVVHALNPGARVLTCVRCEVPLESVMTGAPPLPDAAAVGPHPTPQLQKKDRLSELRLIAEVESQGGADLAVAAAAEGEEKEKERHDARAVTKALIAGPSSSADRSHEEEEYGIGSYVFRSRVPFHPARLWVLLQALAETCEDTGEATAAAASIAATAVTGAAATAITGAAAAVVQMEEEERGQEAGETGGAEGEQQVVLPCFPPPLLRAKGFFWIASLDQAIWELSLAGSQVELEPVGRWLCTMVNPEHWPVGRRHHGTSGDGSGSTGGGDADHPDHNAIIAANDDDAAPHTARQYVAEEGSNSADDKDDEFDSDEDGSAGLGRPRWHHRWGDRRNELAFIGIGLLRGTSARAPTKEGTRSQETQDESRIGQRPTTEQLAGQGGEMERMVTLLRWAQLTGEELGMAREVWEAWNDAPWLGLLEEY